MKQQPRRSNLSHLLSDSELVQSVRQRLLGRDPVICGDGNEGPLIFNEESVDSSIRDGLVESPVSAVFEAIVRETGRPPIFVQDDTFKIPQTLPSALRDALDSGKRSLEGIIPSVGCLEAVNHPSYEYLGTCWRLADDIVVTNRHVASIIARRTPTGCQILIDPMGRIFQAKVDFAREYGKAREVNVAVRDVLFIERNDNNLPDVALLRLVHDAHLPRPLEFATQNAKFNDYVAVLGYPYTDSRNDAFVMDRVFERIYGVKRLSPGQVMGSNMVQLQYDCTTLGGNSGSPVLNMEGKVVGLHFSGNYKIANYAVPVERLKNCLVENGWQSIFFRFDGGSGDVEHLAPRKGYDPAFLGGEIEIPVPGFEDHAIVLIGDDKRELLDYTHFSIQMEADRRFALFTASNIDGEKAQDFPRTKDVWRYDPRIPKSAQAGESLYAGNNLDRGHLVRRLDPAWGDSKDEVERAIEDTFYFTNRTPQHEKLNQRTWLELEDYVLQNAREFGLKLCVFTGPVLRSTDKQYRGFKIPEEYWKVISILNEETKVPSVTGYILSQVQLMDDIEFIYGEFKTYQVPLHYIAKRAGIDFGEITQYDPLNRNEALSVVEIQRASDILM